MLDTPLLIEGYPSRLAVSDRIEGIPSNKRPMSEQDSLAAFRRAVVKSARKKILYLPHAIRQMSRPDRMITGQDVRRVVVHGEIIEDYPEDVRGHSCLLHGTDLDGRPIHVVCSPKPEFLAIITAYTPAPNEWDSSFKVRKTGGKDE